jgi:hypothetical protein
MQLANPFANPISVEMSPTCASFYFSAISSWLRLDEQANRASTNS